MYTKENIIAFLEKRRKKLDCLKDYIPDYNKRLLLVANLDAFDKFIEELRKQGLEMREMGEVQIPTSRKRRILEDMGEKTVECIYNPDKEVKKDGSKPIQGS